jgi:hypothetical protein
MDSSWSEEPAHGWAASVPDSESTGNENPPGKAPAEEDDPWAPLPSTRRLRGRRRRRPDPAPAAPPGEPEDSG